MNENLDHMAATGVIARRVARAASKACLGTLDKDTTAPYTSLVTVALDQSGAPLLLISELAWHTQNLAADPRASILFDGTGGLNEPLEGPRVSYMGTLTKTDNPVHIERFLACHRDAVGYASFADFSFHRMDVNCAHFVGGFGRIETLDAAEVLVNADTATLFEQAEQEIVIHMNKDHSEAVELYATRLLGCPQGAWEVSGCDADGCDLIFNGARARLDFPGPVAAPDETRAIFQQLAAQARPTS